MLHAAAAAGRACNMLATAYTEVDTFIYNASGGCNTRQLTCDTFSGQSVLVTSPNLLRAALGATCYV